MNSNQSIYLPIVIDGNIGSGKTTALQLLKNDSWIRENGFGIVEENVDEWAPYLAAFYENMNRNALVFQMKVLQHHMKQYPYQSDQHTRPSKITERSPLSCLQVFGENLHQSGLMSDLEKQFMSDMNNDFGWMPETVFYIDTPAEVCYERIHRRSRENEVIPMDYLKQIDGLYSKLYKSSDKQPNRPKECFLIDGTKEPTQVLKQILDIMKFRYSKYTNTSALYN